MNNNKRLKFTLLLAGVFFLTCNFVTAQDSAAISPEYNSRVDSMAEVSARERAAKDEQMKNADNLSDLKEERNETKTKAKEAHRVETEANDAARESRIAYRQEQKAQKARDRADKQSKKAARARAKSDKN